MLNVDEIRADLAAFSDSEQEVAIDQYGAFIMSRVGQELSGRLVYDGGQTWVEIDDDVIDYDSFLTRKLAKLDVLASRILEVRGAPDPFIDGAGDYTSPIDGRSSGSALESLRDSCGRQSPFATKLIFLTADAGLGKTELLRHFQQESAKDFLTGGGRSLFWHIDLQGRRLLLLNDALAGNLDELRFYGLWAPGIRRLMKRRDLIVAIDGFDELAAEQGGNEAVGALAHLVRSLDGGGTVVAASRRTFFDTEDYQRRSGLFNRQLSGGCEFEELRLRPWGAPEARKLFGKMSSETRGAALYEQLLGILGGDASHPMLTRPFLVSHIGKAVLSHGIEPEAFGGSAADPLEGVERVVTAFVEREVASKWADRDSGEPYLTVEQHMTILGDVAEEMSLQQVDRLPLDVIESIASIRMDLWSLAPVRQQQVIEMVGMHVLLVRPEAGTDRDRGFDHPEFREYFVARALLDGFREAAEGEVPEVLLKHLRSTQLSDSAARYIFSIGQFSMRQRRGLMLALAAGVDSEWRPTYLQSNAGTIASCALQEFAWAEPTALEAGFVFSSTMLEGTNISGLEIAASSFVNVRLCRLKWHGVRLRECELGDLHIGRDAEFEDVELVDCRISSLTYPDGEDEVRAFSPREIRLAMESLGVRIGSAVESEVAADDGDAASSESRAEQFARRLVMSFYKTSTVTEKTLEQKFKGQTQYVIEAIVPSLVDAGVLRPEQWSGSGSQLVWTVRRSPDDVLKAREGHGDPELVAMWDGFRLEES
jgi:hypothetical protein